MNKKIILSFTLVTSITIFGMNQPTIKNTQQKTGNDNNSPQKTGIDIIAKHFPPSNTKTTQANDDSQSLNFKKIKQEMFTSKL